MTKIKTSDLTGAALDWAVAKCEFPEHHNKDLEVWVTPLPGDDPDDFKYQPSTNWAQGGPIIEREKIAIDWDHTCWNASVEGVPYYISGGATALETAMRCYVALKLGKETEVPEVLA